MSADQRIVTAIRSSTPRSARTGVLVNIAMLSVAYIRRKPPPRRRHHQRSTCELSTAAKTSSPAATVICSPWRHAGAASLFAGACGGNPLISHQALAKIIGSQNSIGMARSLVRRGNGLNGIDGPHSGTARPSAVAPLRRPEALSIDPVLRPSSPTGRDHEEVSRCATIALST